MENQQKVWDNIAPEWDEFKQIPAQRTKEFLENCKGKVLDLGSGSGRHLINLQEGKMYLVDFSPEMIRLAKEKSKSEGINAEFLVSDLTKLEFEDNFFDAAICISALHCLLPEKHKPAIKELHRVLKPGSFSFIGVWNFHSKRFNQKKGKEKSIKWTDKGERYYYLFEEQEIHNLFKETGFKILSTHNSEMMINFIIQKN